MPHFIAVPSGRVLALAALTLLAVEPLGAFEWRAAAPEARGMSAERLEALRAGLEARRSKALLVVRDDAVVLEWYAEGHGADRRHYTASMAKAIVGGVAAAVALGDGALTLDDPAATYVPAWRGDPRRSRITVRHLGSHTSGVEDAEADGLPHDRLPGWKGDFWKRLAVPRDPFTVSRDDAPVLFEPGGDIAYSNPGIARLSWCVTAAIRGGEHRDVRTLLRERVLRPIGVVDGAWSCGYGATFEVDGLPLVGAWGGGAFTARAVARIGRLMLREGDWDGERVLSRDAVRATTRDAGTPGNGGIGWWSNHDGSWEGVPRDAFAGAGAGHQVLLVVPSLGLVVVRNGANLGERTTDATYWPELVEHVFRPVVAAVTDRVSSPYPPSPVISGVTWAPVESIVRRARGSDNWPIAWAADGTLSTAYGDGRGFEPFVEEKLSLGFARVTGGPADFRGENVRAPSVEAYGDGARGRKASGLVVVDGVLYLLARNVGNAQLAWSSDRGATWTWADWRLETSFGCPAFVNVGRDHEGPHRELVYVVSHDADSAYEPADRMVLARAPRERLRERAAWEFLARLEDGRPVWTSDIGARGAVFEHAGRCYRSSMTWIAGLGRWLLVQPQPQGAVRHDGRAGDLRFEGGLAVFDAPEPWGPWTTAYFAPAWDVGPGESASFPAAWASPDGSEAHLVFSGDDAFSVRRATFERRR